MSTQTLLFSIIIVEWFGLMFLINRIDRLQNEVDEIKRKLKS